MQHAQEVKTEAQHRGSNSVDGSRGQSAAQYAWFLLLACTGQQTAVRCRLLGVGHCYCPTRQGHLAVQAAAVVPQSGKHGSKHTRCCAIHQLLLPRCRPQPAPGSWTTVYTSHACRPAARSSLLGHAALHTCKLADHPNSWDIGRMAMLRQIRSMLHTSSVSAVGSTTRSRASLGSSAAA
jgi:hypothetical protein